MGADSSKINVCIQNETRAMKKKTTDRERTEGIYKQIRRAKTMKFQNNNNKFSGGNNNK